MTYSYRMKDEIQQKRASTRLATYVREDWYRKRGRLAELCAEQGQPVSKYYLHQIASGRRRASPELAEAIVAVSKGKLKSKHILDYQRGVAA